jgi:PTH2 family peptidyl-tRNA hydrolase|tara:strand:+ start:11866 stop:12210 length:345 start_codon:yes stop_codon:yes gene_type:complete
MPYKQVIVVRKDLKLSPGKMSVQVAHASVESLWKADGKIASKWSEEGARKVAVYATDEKELLEIFEKAKSMGIPTALITDAGKTEIPPGTKTAVGIGPDTQENLNKITGTLTLV